MQITTPRFDAEKLVLAHGWVFLAPFQWDEDLGVLSRPLRVRYGRHINVRISATNYPDKTVIRVKLPNESDVHPEDKSLIKKQVRRMLCSDIDYSEFHQMCKGHPLLGFVYQHKCGGMLRSPTAFEDLIKTTCTTNCDWRNTKKMCQALCNFSNEPFPTPKRLATLGENFLKSNAPVGYRAKTVVEISTHFKDKPDLEDLFTPENKEEIREFLVAIKGVGAYSANHMLVLSGHHDELPIDSEVASYFQKKHGLEKVPSEKEILAHYKKYKPCSFLAFKFIRMGERLNYINK